MIRLMQLLHTKACIIEMTQFSDIPIEVLHQSFFPKLDYNTRMMLNECLPRDMRFVKKLSREACDAHFCYLQKQVIDTKIDAYNTYFIASITDITISMDRWNRMRADVYAPLAVNTLLYERSSDHHRRAIMNGLENSEHYTPEPTAAAMRHVMSVLKRCPQRPELKPALIAIE